MTNTNTKGETMKEVNKEKFDSYIKFKIGQFIRTNGIDSKTADRKEVAELIRPRMRQWVREAMKSGNC